MANNLGLFEAFIPTPEQRETVKRLKAFSVKEEIIRSIIINPASGEKLSKETFASVFLMELATAKIEGIRSAIHVFYEGMASEDAEVRFKNATKFYQLCSKGLLEPKADIKPTDTIGEKIDKIVDGIQTGNLNTFEADSMSKAIELKAKVEIDSLRAEVEGIKAKLGI